MNLIFMRHGEAMDNTREILSSQEIQCSTLTENGRKQVIESVKLLPKIDKIYASPLIRTLQTAKEVADSQNLNVEIDNRIREINWGKFNGKENSAELDEVREKQVAGDFFIRFGQYGDSKYSIESRLCDFLTDVQKNNFKNNTVLIVSHGTIISFMKRILGLKSSHAKKGKFEVFNDVDFRFLEKHKNLLSDISNVEVSKRLKETDKIKNSETRHKYVNIAKDYNNIEFNNETLKYLILGLNDKLSKVENTLKPIDKSKKEIILVCIFNNFSEFFEKWIRHYVELGVKNFVLVNNNSDDNSIKKINEITKNIKDIKLDLYNVEATYNCFRACSWRQQILDIYGINRWYLNVDSDELFHVDKKIEEYIDSINKNDRKSVKAIMVDVYSKKPIFKNKNISDMKFVDSNTYKTEINPFYGLRIYGGPRGRVFGLRSSLQKVPLLYYTGNELIVNDHYVFPKELNFVNISSVVFHYKFLPNSLSLYKNMAKSGVHWQDSKEYKKYLSAYEDDSNLSMFSKDSSIKIEDFRLSDTVPE